MNIVDNETTLCISLAKRPGNFGNTFHNFLYEKYKLNYLYKSCSTEKLKEALAGVRSLGIRGCALSMPFKTEALEYIDQCEDNVTKIGATNTVVNNNGVLTAYNTDYLALITLVNEYKNLNGGKVVIKGSGGMAAAVAVAFQDIGFNDITIWARNIETGPKLAESIGARHLLELDDNYSILVNCTPTGMPGLNDELSFSKDMIEKSDLVIDSTINPKGTLLIKMANEFNKNSINGEDITKLQAIEQFKLYTGVTPCAEFVDQAFNYYQSRKN